MSVELLTRFQPNGAGPHYFYPQRRHIPGSSKMFGPLHRSHGDVDTMMWMEQVARQRETALYGQFASGTAGMLSPYAIGLGPRLPIVKLHTADEMVFGPFATEKVQAQVAGSWDQRGRQDVRAQVASPLTVSHHPDYWFGAGRRPGSHPGMDPRLEY